MDHYNRRVQFLARSMNHKIRSSSSATTNHSPLQFYVFRGYGIMYRIQGLWEGVGSHPTVFLSI